ncbi:hybrid sensor histidine kinase/response regulator [Pseudomonas borbori]
MSEPPLRPLAEMSLFDLFRSEVQSNAQVLNDGLLALDRDLQDLRVIEPLMRAAHSIKGAASIVNLQPVIKLAHAMEDCLVAAQAGQRRLSNANIDQLLAGVDLMSRAAALDEALCGPWLAENADALAQVIGALGTAPTMAEAPAQMISEPAPATAVASPVSGAASPMPAAQAFKVGAQNFDQILALASEARVIGHSLHPLLQRVQAAAAGGAASLAERLEELEQFERRLLGVSQSLLDEVLAVRMRPFRDGIQAFPRLVRDLGRSLGKAAQLQVEGADCLIDREVLGQLEGALNHLIRNAMDHGLELPDARRAAGKPAEGSIRLEARHQAGLLHLRISDDGQGVAPERIRQAVVRRQMITAEVAAELSEAELLEFLLLPAFSLKEQTTELSGRGVGLDVVADAVRALDGRVLLESQPGQGFSTTLVLPVSRAIVRVLVVELDGEPYGVPISQIEQVLHLEVEAVHVLEGKQFFLSGEARLGLVSARQLLGLGEAPAPSGALQVLVIGKGAQRFGLVVDALGSEQNLALKPLDGIFGKLRDIASAALLDDGSPVLILDVADLLLATAKLLGEGRLQQVGGATRAAVRQTKRVLVVEDSLTVREMERKLLLGRGYAVEVAVDGIDGWNAVRSGTFDLVISDIDMPRMNGLELVELIRKDPRLHALPVMILSYKDRPEDRARGMEVGADYYLTKGSFHDDAMIDAVHDLIGDP